MKFSEMWVRHGDGTVYLVGNIDGGGGLAWHLTGQNFGIGLEISKGKFLLGEAIFDDDHALALRNAASGGDGEPPQRAVRQGLRLLEALTGRVHVSTGEVVGVAKERTECGLAILVGCVETFPVGGVPPHWSASLCKKCQERIET